MERQKPYGYIYKIEFPNGKVYIGLTTTSLKRRKSGHRNCAKGNDTRILYNALRRYTMEDTFELIEIDTADTEEELCRKEIMYISKYNSFDIKYGYNMTYGGEGTNGYVLTEKQREKNSESKKKYYRETPGARGKQLDGRGKNKPFDVFTIDGTFIKSFTYQIDAIEYLQREHNITGTIKVCAVLNGNRKSSAGFVFIYKDEIPSTSES